ncbi:metal ABC transporter solute-binding protein, Zn/Mn family [Cytobacillus sp. BC1816]|uniref:metal ABC transporter solute-binding protein, Zn/Mn family n=1 Tax=Cytobacillus sp. BC1816 TaxID=3440154 RepID=UPI003F519122
MDLETYEPTKKSLTKIGDADLFILIRSSVGGFADKPVKTFNNENIMIKEADEGINLLEGTHDHDHGDEEPKHAEEND